MPSCDRAVEQYAKFQGLDITTVTLETVRKSEQGLEHWACFGLDMSARGAVGQQINRAFAKKPSCKDVYKWLTEDLKRKFRMTWSIERDFDVVVKKRIRSITNKTKQSELGSWKNELQLQNHFGGAQYPEACRQAANYISMRKQFEARSVF